MYRAHFFCVLVSSFGILLASLILPRLMSPTCYSGTTCHFWHALLMLCAFYKYLYILYNLLVLLALWRVQSAAKNILDLAANSSCRFIPAWYVEWTCAFWHSPRVLPGSTCNNMSPAHLLFVNRRFCITGGSFEYLLHISLILQLPCHVLLFWYLVQPEKLFKVLPTWFQTREHETCCRVVPCYVCVFVLST